jgi:acetyl esterase/lipase
MKKISLYMITCLVLSSLLTFAQDIKPIVLYPNGVPNSKPAPADYVEPDMNKVNMIDNVSEPMLYPFFPEKGKANGTAVIICPGGGYKILAIHHEGFDVAKEFNKIGITAFVLKYRLPSDAIMADKTIGPLQDAQQAILILRTHAAEWGINPSRIGIMGFSAGGHLASTAGTHLNKAVIDNKANVSLRPDFMILIYPVITFGEWAHISSRDNLVGKNASAELINLYSNEKLVTANTPITFMVQAEDDTTVPVQNSLIFYDALVKAKVSAEMHIYPAGGHGFGLNNKKSKAHWFDWCTSWLDTNGLLSAN